MILTIEAMAHKENILKMRNDLDDEILKLSDMKKNQKILNMEKLAEKVYGIATVNEIQYKLINDNTIQITFISSMASMPGGFVVRRKFRREMIRRLKSYGDEVTVEVIRMK